MSEEYVVAFHYTPAVVSFPCVCGAQLTIHRHSIGSLLSGCFCQKCDEQYYIRWNEGVLRRGKMGEAVQGRQRKGVSKRFIRACVWPLFWFVCRNFPACPNCQSWNGTVSGYSGDNGKTHGYPDYAPPTVEHHYCLQCKHVWTRRYHQFPDWYYAIRCFPARLMSNRTYHRILDRIDYSIPLSQELDYRRIP